MHQGMTPPEWDALLSKATQHFFPKLPAPPQADSADTILARDVESQALVRAAQHD